MIAVFWLLNVAVLLENPAGAGKRILFRNIKIQIPQFPVFGNRIIGGEADAL